MKGLVLKQSDFGEGHRMLWIFTEEYGIIKAVVHGARRTKSKAGASSQFLSYGDFDFYTGSDIWTVNSVKPIDSFFPLQEDITRLSLCTYFADITYGVMEMNNPDEEVLRLLLNTLYACAYKKVSLEVLKPVFELRLMALGGYAPVVSACTACGNTEEIAGFDARQGGVVCASCRKPSAIPLQADVYRALYYILTCDSRKLFSFQASPEVLEALGQLAEAYVITCIDRSVKSLEYYKMMRGL